MQTKVKIFYFTGNLHPDTIEQTLNGWAETTKARIIQTSLTVFSSGFAGLTWVTVVYEVSKADTDDVIKIPVPQTSSTNQQT